MAGAKKKTDSECRWLGTDVINNNNHINVARIAKFSSTVIVIDIKHH